MYIDVLSHMPTVTAFVGGVAVGVLITFLLFLRTILRTTFNGKREKIVASMLLIIIGIGCVASGYQWSSVNRSLVISAENARISVDVLNSIRKGDSKSAIFLLENVLYENLGRHLSYLKYSRYLPDLNGEQKYVPERMQYVLSYFTNYPNRMCPITNMIAVPCELAGNYQVWEESLRQNLHAVYGVATGTVKVKVSRPIR